jgi:hypothetical protein
MPFDSDNQCADGKHNFSPIIEGGETVGLKCSLCPKTVYENMEFSDYVVTSEGLAFMPRFAEGGYVRRKDSRF